MGKNISRRDFLKGALAGSAAVALSSVAGVTAFADDAKALYTPERCQGHHGVQRD